MIMFRRPLVMQITLMCLQSLNKKFSPRALLTINSVTQRVHKTTSLSRDVTWSPGGRLLAFFARISMRNINFLAKTSLHFNKQIPKTKFTWKVHILQATVTFCTLSVVVSNSPMWYFLIFCNNFRYLARTAQHRAFVRRTRQKIREASSLGLFHLTI